MLCRCSTYELCFGKCSQPRLNPILLLYQTSMSGRNTYIPMVLLDRFADLLVAGHRASGRCEAQENGEILRKLTREK